MRIVLDTNVLVSALLFPGSKPDQILQLARRSELTLILSPFILEEARKVLTHAIHLLPVTVTGFLQTLERCAEIVHPTEQLHVVTAKDSDNRILECAMAGRADFLITGDTNHLIPLGTIGTTKITTPAAFLAATHRAL
jgi:putative PIN family toxin of toxin-antitoxin system